MTVVGKVTQELAEGDIVITKAGEEHLILRLKHHDDKTTLRTLDLSTGEPKSRRWKHDRAYQIDNTMSQALALSQSAA